MIIILNKANIQYTAAEKKIWAHSLNLQHELSADY